MVLLIPFPIAVEFPAVLLNTSNGDIEDEFHRYVQPQENPVLSDFCKKFTDITQVRIVINMTTCIVTSMIVNLQRTRSYIAYRCMVTMY